MVMKKQGNKCTKIWENDTYILKIITRSLGKKPRVVQKRETKKEGCLCVHKVGQSGIWVWVGENGWKIPPLVL